MVYRLTSALVIATLFCALLGCSGQIIHRVDQQQGNVITNSMLAKLKPRMNKEQVQFVLGLPVLRNSFDSSRWDYIYTYAERSRNPEKRHLTLHFDDDILIRVEGNFDLENSEHDSEEETDPSAETSSQ